jgi:predicted hydrocarbon binding protein
MEETGLKEALDQNGGFFLDFEIFALMKNALIETFASGAGVIIATMAKPCGRKICREIARKAMSTKEILNQFCVLVNEHNWGELSFVNLDFDNGSGRVVVKNSFEARKSMSKSPCCHFMANFIAGFIAELFNKKVIVKEVKCTAKGDDYCEFKF